MFVASVDLLCFPYVNLIWSFPHPDGVDPVILTKRLRVREAISVLG